MCVKCWGEGGSVNPRWLAGPLDWGGDELNLGQVVTLLTCVKGNKSLKLLRSFQSGHVRNGPKPTNQGIDNVTYRAAGKLKTVILVSISSFQISKLKVHFGNIWIEWSRCKFQSPHPCFYCTYILSQNLFYAFKLGAFHNKTGFWCKSSIKGPVLIASKHTHSYQDPKIHDPTTIIRNFSSSVLPSSVTKIQIGQALLHAGGDGELHF